MSGWKLSVLARADIIDVLEFGLDAFGEQQAEKYRAGIEKTLDLLAIFPQMARERAEFQQPLRVHHYVRHYIAYIIEEGHILILRVIRDDADLDRLFGVI